MSKIYLNILELLDLKTPTSIDRIKFIGFTNDEILKALKYLSLKKYVLIDNSNVWRLPEGDLYLKNFVKVGDDYKVVLKMPKGVKPLSELTWNWHQRFFKDFNKRQPNKILLTDKTPITQRIMKISFMEWVGIFSIISSVIAIWIYVLFPIVKDFLNWMGW